MEMGSELILRILLPMRETAIDVAKNIMFVIDLKIESDSRQMWISSVVL